MSLFKNKAMTTFVSHDGPIEGPHEGRGRLFIDITYLLKHLMPKVMSEQTDAFRSKRSMCLPMNRFVHVFDLLIRLILRYRRIVRKWKDRVQIIGVFGSYTGPIGPYMDPDDRIELNDKQLWRQLRIACLNIIVHHPSYAPKAVSLARDINVKYRLHLFEPTNPRGQHPEWVKKYTIRLYRLVAMTEAYMTINDYKWLTKAFTYACFEYVSPSFEGADLALTSLKTPCPHFELGQPPPLVPKSDRSSEGQFLLRPERVTMPPGEAYANNWEEYAAAVTDPVAFYINHRDSSLLHVAGLSSEMMQYDEIKAVFERVGMMLSPIVLKLL